MRVFAIALLASLSLALGLPGKVRADSVGIVSDMWAGDARMAMDLIAVQTPEHRVLWMGGSGSL